MQLPTPQQALLNLYKAARSVTATADTHEALRVCYDVLSKEITPKPVEPAAPEKPQS